MYKNLTEQERKEILDFIVTKGDYALSQLDLLQIDTHEDQVDVTTNIDLSIEKDFIQYISSKYSGYAILGEEFGDNHNESDYKWIIDPIDGTKYYIYGIPLWTVTVALLYKNEPVFGVIYNPSTKQLYWGEKGKGAYINGKVLSTNKTENLDKTQLVIDYTQTYIKDTKKRSEMNMLIGTLVSKFYKTRWLGTGTLSLVWLAQGCYGVYLDLYRTEGKSVLDSAAGIIIVKEAGAFVYSQAIDDVGSILIIAANKAILEKTKKFLIESKILFVKPNG